MLECLHAGAVERYEGSSEWVRTRSAVGEILVAKGESGMRADFLADIKAEALVCKYCPRPDLTVDTRCSGPRSRRQTLLLWVSDRAYLSRGI